MIRLLSEGLLIGWDKLIIVFWLCVAGTFVGHGIWYCLLAWGDWLRRGKIKLASEEALDKLKEARVEAYEEHKARDQAEEENKLLRRLVASARNQNRNWNADAAQVVKERR